MKRFNIPELEDFVWFPHFLREGVTDCLQFLANVSKGLNPIAPMLAKAIKSSKATQVLDLASGAGGPWLTLLPALEEEGVKINVVLSDLFPSEKSYQWQAQESAGRITAHSEPVDFTEKVEIKGLRTLFNSLHHLNPKQVEALLLSTMKSGEAIAMFDGEDKKVVGPLVMLMSFPAPFFLTPFIKPFKFSRWIFTYFIPLIPFVILIDGVISFLRTYSTAELQEIVSGLPSGYDWEVGVHVVPKNPFGISYVIGVPSK